jgi:pimeloyl-ACP methyl ester carboxylesterase
VGVKPDLICGHSFGGKVAMAYAKEGLAHGWHVPRHTWVFDSLPGAVDRHKAIGEQSVAEVGSGTGLVCRTQSFWWCASGGGRREGVSCLQAVIWGGYFSRPQ